MNRIFIEYSITYVSLAKHRENLLENEIYNFSMLFRNVMDG